MNGLKGRLRRLEATARNPALCPECGLPPDGPGFIVFASEKPEGPDDCPRCGRPLWFVIEVVGEEVSGV